MHLINIKTERLKKFEPRQKPKYAVLSHCWTKNELTFKDIQVKVGTKIDAPDKFWYTLKQTRRNRLQLVWIDTCCIDKSNNVELSEAINSMYRWYQEAQFCYVYLEDVEIEHWKDTFPKSKWFKRGWTLQELLAPKHVIFYDRSWKRLGDKKSLADKISETTGIAADVLETGNFSHCSIAQRMAWAAKRTTTRPEDQAYCLMGLFNVNMPLLYGEGDRAFLRLQEEIVRYNDDHSIFAWSMGKRRVSGLFAPSPSSFTKCQDVVKSLFLETHEPFFMTNRGLSITLQVTPWSTDTYLACLDCANQSRSHGDTVRTGIFLRRLSAADQYVRINLGRKGLWFDTKSSLPIISQRNPGWPGRPSEKRQIFVRQNVDFHDYADSLISRIYGFKLPNTYSSSAITCPAFAHFTPNTHIAALQPGGWGCTVQVSTTDYSSSIRKVALGFDFDFNPICLLEDSYSEHAWLDGWDIWARIEKDEIALDSIVETGLTIRQEIAEYDGLWALKGDRNQDMNVLLSHARFGQGPIVTIKRKTVETGIVWEFDLNG